MIWSDGSLVLGVWTFYHVKPPWKVLVKDDGSKWDGYNVQDFMFRRALGDMIMYSMKRITLVNSLDNSGYI